MNEKIKGGLGRVKNFWFSRTSKQKSLLVGLPVLLVLIIGISTYFLTKENLVPLYSNLSPSETGQIKETLDSKGVTNEIKDNGKTIYVPDNVVDELKVDLASKGIPNSGTIDYEFFGKNSNFSMTDNEFNVVKLEAMQNELANLMKEIDGINNAKVMINLPQDSVWVTDQASEASASIVLETKPGYKFTQDQVTALYHLVSKSVPNLPTSNIVITDQFFDSFDLKNNDNDSSDEDPTDFASQQRIKKSVERDIQLQVQQLLGKMMGADKVAVGVTADIDFTQKKSKEELVEPVDKENMQGIAISSEKIKETFAGSKPSNGGVAGTGQNDISNYQADSSSNNGDYSKEEDRINYDVNKIKNEIVASPYRIRDLSIQLAVEPPNPKDVNSLPQQTIDEIKQMLGTIVKTSIDKGYNPNGQELSQDQVNQKVAVSVAQFKGKDLSTASTKTTIPLWMYIAGAALLIIIIVLIILLLRKRNEEEVLVEDLSQPIIDVPDINDETETDGTVRRKQLEKMAKEKPEEFAKLLRSWITED
ncbi:flagellar basal-body MS-ring/collar protein FliF [Gottfriedia luciferensis]|uniref:flagellar basal-body MS-ring/collar protein FliF n=1 Tax=Gottfriedia luciferensis TaxID=178774 RepID=UPI000B431F9A|nr:flagellar basal-body MS-ring/collar protein FliF [Gottfriedia luciferensis]